MIEIFPQGSDTKSLNRVKFGIDPTFPKLHLGHLVPLRVVRKMQEQGKDVTIVLGTFTAQMGDPSGRDSTRPILSKKEVEENAEIILQQIKPILKPGFKVFRNGDLFNTMSVPRLMKIVSDFTVQQIVKRDAFANRMSKDIPIGIHELIVPILQGTDSVKLKSEIEIGGTDQLFNFQIARRLQEINGQEPEVCILTPIINGTDGRKMSKSFGNCIFLDESPEEIFGKCMSISDEVMEEWIPLFQDENKEANPMVRKKKLAFDIVSQIWGKRNADWAQAHFEDTVQAKNIPDDIMDIGESMLLDAVIAIRNCSKTEARRLLASGAVSVDKKKTSENIQVNTGQIIQVGKRNFGRII
jgi:tyrosyl-tRNA synthetase